MDRVRLGQSPVEVVPLGVGCWAWGDKRYWRYEVDLGPQDVVDGFAAALAAGLDFFDTAEAYGAGKSEQLLGWLVRQAPRPTVVATKYAPLVGRGGPAAIPRALEASLKRMRLPHVDLYQLHWADRDEAPIGPTMAAFAATVHAGQARAVGVSNFRAGELRAAHAALAAHGVPLATNQVRYSLLDRTPETDGVLDACRELGVTLLAYSPLEQGVLGGRYSPDVRPAGLRGDAEWFAPERLAAAKPVLELLGSLAAAHEVEMAAIALAWLLAKPGVIPLPGATRGAQVTANARALSVTLSDGEIAALDAVKAD
ncbi:MAG: aldo/keto reductase [Deltaproteobacteria bacterium]|nr:aldo/keto reductase [Deltaproteobacteria bacterium]